MFPPHSFAELISAALVNRDRHERTKGLTSEKKIVQDTVFVGAHAVVGRLEPGDRGRYERAGGVWQTMLMTLHWWFSLFAVKFRVGVGSFPEPAVPGGVASCFSNASSIDVGVAASPHTTPVRAPKAGAAACCCPNPPPPKALPPAPNTGKEFAAGCANALGATNFATLSGVHAKPLPARAMAREYECHGPAS